MANRADNKKLVTANIPADGLFLAILRKANGDLSYDNCSRIITEYIDKYLECKPDILFLNVCYRRSLVPSEVFDSYLYDIETDDNGFARKDESGRTIKHLSPTSEAPSKYFGSFLTCARKLLADGTDIFKIITKRIRAAGCKVYFSVRMNDGHYTDNPAVNSAFALRNGGVHTLKKDGVSLDFSQKAVQNHFNEYIRELLENYEIDGIELDWLRYPGILPVALRADFSIIGDYMASVRALLDEFDKNLGIAVRLLPNEQDNLADGVDAAGWIANGTTDILTIENFYVPTNYEMPVQQWRDSIAAKNTQNRSYTLLCGSDWGVSCMKNYDIAINPALVRGFVSDCLYRGADGVYLFNFFEEDDTSSWELIVDSNGCTELKDCFVERMKAANHPEDLPRRYAHIGASNTRYPIALSNGEAYTFTQLIQKPFGTCTLTVACDADVTLHVCVDGAPVEANFRKEVTYPGFEFIPESEIGKKSNFIYAVSQIAPYVFSVDIPENLLNENVMLTIKNTSAQQVNFRWIEVSCHN